MIVSEKSTINSPEKSPPLFKEDKESYCLSFIEIVKAICYSIVVPFIAYKFTEFINASSRFSLPRVPVLIATHNVLVLCCAPLNVRYVHGITKTLLSILFLISAVHNIAISHLTYSLHNSPPSYSQYSQDYAAGTLSPSSYPEINMSSLTLPSFISVLNDADAARHPAACIYREPLVEYQEDYYSHVVCGGQKLFDLPFYSVVLTSQITPPSSFSIDASTTGVTTDVTDTSTNASEDRKAVEYLHHRDVVASTMSILEHSTLALSLPSLSLWTMLSNANAFQLTMAAGLVFSLFGDVFLIFSHDTAFLLGLVAFLSAHLAYLYANTSLLLSNMMTTPRTLYQVIQWTHKSATDPMVWMGVVFVSLIAGPVLYAVLEFGDFRIDKTKDNDGVPLTNDNQVTEKSSNIKNVSQNSSKSQSSTHSTHPSRPSSSHASSRLNRVVKSSSKNPNELIMNEIFTSKKSNQNQSHQNEEKSNEKSHLSSIPQSTPQSQSQNPEPDNNVNQVMRVAVPCYVLVISLMLFSAYAVAFLSSSSASPLFVDPNEHYSHSHSHSYSLSHLDLSAFNDMNQSSQPSTSPSTPIQNCSLDEDYPSRSLESDSVLDSNIESHMESLHPSLSFIRTDSTPSPSLQASIRSQASTAILHLIAAVRDAYNTVVDRIMPFLLSLPLYSYIHDFLRTHVYLPLLSVFSFIPDELHCTYNYATVSLQAWRAWFLFIGAFLFAISDVFVAKQQFLTKTPLNRTIGLPIYYYAQLFMAASLRY